MGVDSAWYGHVPFGYWLTSVLRPKTVVELGTHAGVSYSSFCDAIIDTRLATSAYAVDTWLGDKHAGEYGEQIYTDWMGFHDERYASFSNLLRMTFDEARDEFEDGTIDLLHIDGLHTYDAVSHDVENWLPKLAPDGVLLLHDITERRDDFGVWRLWAQLRGQFPSFEFLHAHGLGMIAPNGVPDGIAAVLNSDESDKAAIRARFAAAGERWISHVVATFAQAAQRVAGAELERVVIEHALHEREIASRWDADLKQLEAEAEQGLVNAKALAAAERLELEERAQQREADLRAQGFLDTQRLTADIEQLRKEHFDVQAAGQSAVAKLRQRIAQDVSELHDATREANETVAARDGALSVLQSRIDELLQERDRHAAWSETATARAAEAERDRAQIAASPFWRITLPARSTLGRIPPARRSQIRSALRPLYRRLKPVPEHAAPAPANTALPDSLIAIEAHRIRAELVHAPVAPAGPDGPRIIYISGEPATAGHHYRVARPVSALGRHAIALEVSSAPNHLDAIEAADIVVLWRVSWNESVQLILDAARRGGARIVFDVDDLMFDPALATTEVIDGIRSQGFQDDAVAAMYVNVQRVLLASDAAVAPTHALARQLKRFVPETYVIPNGFDEPTRIASRLAARTRSWLPPNVTLRIGYAGGSRTHQRDFAQAVPAIARLLSTRQDVRLVLFETGRNMPLVDIEEYPELLPVASKIEWRRAVPLSELPPELARFDVNLLPLEVGNPFCESKSELKYFEAALAGVPTVASPTEPMVRAIKNGVTGFLAQSEDQWFDAISRLLDSPDLRAEVADAAYLQVLWAFGPERRRELLLSLDSELTGGRDGARAFIAEQKEDAHQVQPLPRWTPPRVVLQSDTLVPSPVTVIVPLYNYGGFVVEALDSVMAQTSVDLDLVVVDDCSTDDSLDVARRWIEANVHRFNRAVLVQNHANLGLAQTRNIGFHLADTPWVLPLDADNMLRPTCVERLLATAVASGAQYCYPMIQRFGSTDYVMGSAPYRPARLATGNFIDAMALVSKAAWAAVGGYDETMRHGHEDYELWLRLADRGLRGEWCQEILADYRDHPHSMLDQVTEVGAHRRLIAGALSHRYPWIDAPSADPFDNLRPNERDAGGVNDEA